MWNKFKKILIKTPWKALTIYFIVASIIIFLDKITCNLSFFDQFQSDGIEKMRLYIEDLQIIYDKFKPLFYSIYVFDIILISLKIILKKDSIKIMIVNTFENTKVNILTKYLYENVESPLDLSKDVKRLGTYYLGYKEIVKDLDNYVEKFMSNREEKYFAFAGILHTPFILRLGFKVGDQTYFKLFHKKREEEIFKLLNDKNDYVGNYPEIIMDKQLKESDELIISIATTFEIKKEQLKKFDIENKNYIKFETTVKGFDVINSEKQVNKYKKYIFSNIREVIKEKNIKLIHLCISSSVAFTFALGQGFSQQYDPDVIIYNFDRQQYTWGLNLFENAENSIVYNEESLIN